MKRIVRNESVYREGDAIQLPSFALTCSTFTPNMAAHDRPNHLALPHRRAAGQWREGCGVQDENRRDNVGARDSAYNAYRRRSQNRHLGRGSTRLERGKSLVAL